MTRRSLTGWEDGPRTTPTLPGLQPVSTNPSPYQTTAEVPMLETVSEFTDKLSAALLRAAESVLNKPSLGHFIANGRMNLRTFVYQVRSVELVAATEVRKRSVYRYQIKADGLEPMTVVMTYKLPDADFSVTARSLSIGRVLDNALQIVPRKETYTTVAAGESADEPLVTTT